MTLPSGRYRRAGWPMLNVANQRHSPLKSGSLFLPANKSCCEAQSQDTGRSRVLEVRNFTNISASDEILTWPTPVSWQEGHLLKSNALSRRTVKHIDLCGR